VVQNWNKASVVRVVQAQDAPAPGTKYVDVELDSPRYAAKVVKVTVGNKVVIPGEFRPHMGPSGVPFQAGDDWLKELRFTIKNRSSKTFVWLSFAVSFPDTHRYCAESITGECETGMVVELGRIPDVDAYTDQGNRVDQGSKQPIDFRPGQEMEISLAPYADELRRKVEERQPFSTISRCFINLANGYFEDGMYWGLADYRVPDPSHRGRLKPLDDPEIPVKDKRAVYAPGEAHD
jgi:hypothetical protein